MITLNYWINQIADMPVCQNGVWVDLETGFTFESFVSSEKAIKQAAKAEKMAAVMAKTMRGEKLAAALSRRDSLLKGQSLGLSQCTNEKALLVMREAIAALTALDTLYIEELINELKTKVRKKTGVKARFIQQRERSGY